MQQEESLHAAYRLTGQKITRPRCQDSWPWKQHAPRFLFLWGSMSGLEYLLVTSFFVKIVLLTAAFLSGRIHQFMGTNHG